jgi:FKBP-type peptidyl-prolyl cis-trans isomerase 2
MLQKKDFVEVEFTARIKNTNEVFDSNIKKDLKKANLNVEAKPFVFSIGEGMFLKGIEDLLIGKDLGEYKFELTPENAFGPRDSKLIQIIPMKVFKEQNLNPVQGFMFNFDGRIAKVISVSGGRVIVDFNNPVAGKDVVYDVKILRKIEDLNEKIKSYIHFFFRKDFDFEVKEDKIILNVDKDLKKFAELFSDKFKEAFEKNLEVMEKEDNKEPVN